MTELAESVPDIKTSDVSKTKAPASRWAELKRLAVTNSRAALRVVFRNNQIQQDSPKDKLPVFLNNEDSTPARQIGIKPQRVRRLIQGMDPKNVLPPYTDDSRLIESRKVEARLAKISGSKKIAQELEDLFKREDRFVHYAHQINLGDAEEGLSPLETRVTKADLVSLYDLLVLGRLDSFYQGYVSNLSKKGQKSPESEEEVLMAKVKIANAFLSWRKKKDEEGKMPSDNSLPITMGYEIEYSPLTVQILSELNSNFEQPLTTLRKHPKKFINSLLLARQLFGSGLLSFIGDAQDSALKYPRVTSTLNRVSTHIESIADEVGVSEIRTYPTTSPRTQLRELTTIVKAGGLDDSWNIHETIVGIDLTPEHTEAMDMSAIAAVAYTPKLSFSFSRQAVELIRSGKLKLNETSPKRSFVDSPPYYFFFPYHKRRSADEVINYPNQQERASCAVEFRPLPQYGKDSFSLLVRDSTFRYLAAWAVRAVQMDPSLRTANDIRLVECWADLMHGWQELLSEYNIPNPPNIYRYYTQPKQDQANPYMVFMSRLSLESQINPEFSTKVRGLIRSYNKQVRAIVGYR